ncbi:cupin domain-containing protein [Chryseobacterium chendengshani]|uniref:cupin domain-containing protein n=1 Tax=Chryseobacterium sp. LJ668 TaxID=2864040 RepID=UPI001C68D0B2|nr:cupin domain-containing protein [Chryseobacterium sp. LJ668]MBW8523761.1 cupin domain-containing protein [Chryseobacterium sp. LJ668]QYK16705.1 cupin domain-containing protein [Chryseobacterium sp. LJ668]
MNNNDLDESFGTLSQTINELAKLGYTHDFNNKDDCEICHNENLMLSPIDFKIDKVYRFEGNSDPDYQSILYVISSTKFNVKGILVNGYGISADDGISKIIEKLSANPSNDLIENKMNDSTSKRPEGERILDASMVEINVNDLLKQIKDEKTWAESDRNSMTVFKSDTMRILIIGLHQNAELKPHTAAGIISVQVLEGQIEFYTELQNTILEKGQMIALHENITHSVKALKDSFFLLTISMTKKVG